MAKSPIMTDKIYITLFFLDFPNVFIVMIVKLIGVNNGIVYVYFRRM